MEIKQLRNIRHKHLRLDEQLLVGAVEGAIMAPYRL